MCRLLRDFGFAHGYAEADDAGSTRTGQSSDSKGDNSRPGCSNSRQDTRGPNMLLTRQDRLPHPSGILHTSPNTDLKCGPAGYAPPIHKATSHQQDRLAAHYCPYTKRNRLASLSSLQSETRSGCPHERHTPIQPRSASIRRAPLSSPPEARRATCKSPMCLPTKLVPLGTSNYRFCGSLASYSNSGWFP